MNNTIKKVLSYIAVAFLGFATGVGCLIGVSSCSSVSGDDQQEKQQLNIQPKGRKIVPGVRNGAYDPTTAFEKSKTYYIVIKNYSNNGNGYLWDGDSISLTNSSIMSSLSNLYTQSMLASIDIIDDSSNFLSRYLDFSPALDGGLVKLASISIRNSDYSINQVLYSTNGAVFNRAYCGFIFTNFSYISPNDDLSKGYFYSNLNQWFNVYELDTWAVSYDFGQYFNYNNFAQRPNQDYINRALFPISGLISSISGNNTFTFDMPWFKSGSFVFNQIKIVFGLDLGYTFENSNGEWVTYAQPVVDNYNTYFSSMSYINSATNYEQLVCNRVSYSSGTGYSATHIFYKPSWTSQEFQQIYLQNDISSMKTRNILSGVVIENPNAVITQQNNDVGLGNVFSLISLAFASWVPILQIQIVPGITIGLLLFLPLISGIIILVIWIVKR